MIILIDLHSVDFIVFSGNNKITNVTNPNIQFTAYRYYIQPEALFLIDNIIDDNKMVIDY